MTSGVTVVLQSVGSAVYPRNLLGGELLLSI